MAGGGAVLDAVRALAESAQQRGEAQWFTVLDQADWLTPVEPANCICAGRNFAKHASESKAAWSAQGATGIHFEFPTGFIKLPGVLVPHRAPVRRPPDVAEFDYEVEIAAVVGRPIERVGEGEALAAVFGYTVFNDLSAREWQRREMRNQMIVIGKNFPGFAPIGPWILTADEVPDPQRLGLALRVNGQARQDASTAEMIFSMAELVAFWSRAGRRPGDIITSGTPEGVALHHKPDPFEWYLRPGDRVEAEVEGIGVLETPIT
jgi:2-keto-4-pentenoate hydratase/2-oxohepta-3-ene-1,7-dioic acid hydratase in catechol pathway